MATATASSMATMAAPYPRHDADVELRDRRDMEVEMRLWTLRARFFARDLLMLGRPYTVQYTLPAGVPHPVSVDDLPELGFELLPLLGSHVMQIKRVFSSRGSSGGKGGGVLSQRITSLHTAPLITSDVSPLDAMQPCDFLIGLNDDDVLLVPSGSQSQVRKRILHECNQALQQRVRGGVTGEVSTVLTLKFVRMDRVVQVDPTRQLAHGNVLAALDELESHHHALAQRYDELQSVNRAAVTQRLSRHLKLLRHCHGVMCDLKDACMEVFAYQIAEQFQAWLAVELADFDPRYDEKDDDDENKEHEHEQEQDQPQEDVSMDGPTVFDIDDDDDDDEENEDQNGDDNNRQAGGHHPPQRATAATRGQRLGVLGAANADLRWRDVLHPHEMKWLPQSHAVLTKFIEGLADGFASDGVWGSDMAVRSRSIVERLVVLYAKKLQTTPTDNGTVKKEFLQHARMLRSNVVNAGNKQLRADLLSGALSVVTLCEMTSEQLAPEALQAERQRREETHTKEITLSEPTGPRLVKTKHGFKEVNLGGPNDQQETENVGTSEPPVEQGSGALHHKSANKTAATTETKLTDEVTKRLGAIEFEKEKESHFPKPAPAQERRAPPPPPLLQSQPRQLLSHRDQFTAPPARAQPSVARDVSSVETARYSAEDGRVFLRAMFDPDQEVVEDTLRRLQETIHSTNILATMHSELKIAGISMYRDLQAMQMQYGVQHRARVRLLHWKFEYVGRNDREATIGALSRLVKELEEYRRLFGQLLEQLRYELHFPQPLHNHHAHRLAINLLVRQGMSLKAQRRDNGDFRAEAQLDRMILAVAHDSSDPAARDRAAHDATAFLSDLVARKRFPSHTVARDSYRELEHWHWRRDEDRPRELLHAFPRAEEYRQSDRDPYGDGDIRRSLEPAQGLMDRKRPLEPGHFTEQPPPPQRRRVEQEEAMANRVGRNAPPEVESAPLFFTDARGQTEPTPIDPHAKEQAEVNQVEAYHELVKALIRNRDDVLERAKSVDWDPRVPEKTIEFSSRLRVVRKISRHSVKNLFQCEVRGMDGNLYIFSENASLDSAAQHVMKTLRKWLDDIRCNWLALADTYKAIMQRKEKQRGRQADAALSAANETRKDRAASRFVEDKERKRGHMFEYVVYVQSLVAVRQVCLNMKMAKRAAGEEFRDLMIWINRTRADMRNGSAPTQTPTGRSASPATATATATTATCARAAPKPRKHASNMIILSDDSDDDDGDDDDYYGSGGAYSDDDDWHPQPKQPSDNHARAAGAASATSGGKSARFRVETMLAEPYPVESERSSGDDARLRAVLRSLFTPEDDLCTEISAIRGALKYRGQFDKQVVPNVKASIRLDLLRGDVFNVYASANDVVHYKATATSKQEACDKAVDGLLEELNNTRRMWVQLVHFYHVKEMGTNDPMRSFHALQLANIARIETKIEPPPASSMHNRPLEAKMATRVHCVMYIGGKVVFRVDEDLEQDAHTIATCRTVQFLVDLIDKGLDPMPVDIQDNDFRPMRRVDWSCMVSLQDFGNRRELVEYHADASWAIAGRVPREDCDFVVPSRATLRQVNRVPVQEMERSLNVPQAFFFRLEATYENGKFVNHVAEYGNKNKNRAYVLELEVVENPRICVFVFPPGASVNSESNLYWSHKVMPRELADRKAVYGVAMDRRFALSSGTRW